MRLAFCTPSRTRSSFFAPTFWPAQVAMVPPRASKGVQKNMLILLPVDTAAKITETHFTKSSICVIGNEGNGISQGVKQVCDDLVTIPMKGRAESLNASVAAAITMWEMMR